MIRNLKNSIKSIGVKLDTPVFLKAYESQDTVISELEHLKIGIDDEKILKSIDRDIKLIKYGDQGEKQVAFELVNSYIPMYCLHNITLKHNGLKAQFDYILITSKYIVVLETKTLNGNIEIRNNGDFIRSVKSYKGKTLKKEGMYSPISQNERHIELLEKFLKHHKIIKYAPIHSLVVMANPKSILNYKYAPKTIKNQVVKYDQLKNKLKELNEKTNEVNMAIITMKEIGEFILYNSEKAENTFTNKYEQYKYDVLQSSNEVIDKISKSKRNSEQLEKELKAFRLENSRSEGIKPYYIFNNAQMEEMIKAYPRTKDELIALKGFGPVKFDKYGKAILAIFNLDD